MFQVIRKVRRFCGRCASALTALHALDGTEIIAGELAAIARGGVL